MEQPRQPMVDSALGRQEIDSHGPPIGVVRVDPSRSYAGVGELLRRFIDESDQGAWDEIRRRIDYTYEALDLALAPLDTETGFSREIRARAEGGQKVLFKPNLVMPQNIDPQTHGPGYGSTTCTEWPFVAALMRWFHDKVGIRYHQMALGEAATQVSAMAGTLSILNRDRGPVTPEAVIEGRAGDFYGGWGFYFARKYLSEALGPGQGDDPMRGHDESVSGTYVAPGRVSDRLMVYDLNRICDDAEKGRAVEVADGVNYRSIILHKVVVGGDPSDPADRKVYPGCVLINVPKLKVHSITLFTNVIKNLGIGLYPMQATFEGRGSCQWEYSMPHVATPGIKGNIPHQTWVAEVDFDTGVPRRDEKGGYVVRKTGGILATMVDIVKAVRDQGVYMFHAVDAVEAINVDHMAVVPGTKEPEGLAFFGVDPVAMDLLCARYLFNNVPLEKAGRAASESGLEGTFLQRVPLPTVKGVNIVTGEGYDNPLSRDISFAYAEQRGLGATSYHAVGRDAVAGYPLVTVRGHLGMVRDGGFTDLVTKSLYYDALKMPWDLQRTAFAYLECSDYLTGSSAKEAFLSAYDEDGDGVVTYEEFGKNGMHAAVLFQSGSTHSIVGTEELGYLRGPFSATATRLKWGRAAWNVDRHDFFEPSFIGQTCMTAYRMSLSETESPDPSFPSLTWGKGKWPSFRFADYTRVATSLYGPDFRNRVRFPSLFGHAFRYADLTQNGGGYTGTIVSQPAPDALDRYFAAVKSDKTKFLDFILFVPPGYGRFNGTNLPNVEETGDPARILTVRFAGGRETWPDMRVKG